MPRPLLSLFALGLILASEHAPTRAEAAPRDEVAARHALEREAHMDRNVELLLSLQADDFVLIDAGEVLRPTRAEQAERFGAYFASVRFLKWDDLAPPSIRVSADGTLATVVVRKEVVLVPADAGEDARPSRAVFAWMETWEKRRGRWLMVALCSTRAPAEPPAD